MTTQNPYALIVFRATLMLLSLLATFSFLVGMGDGITSILFALAGTLTQAAALIFLPDIIQQQWSLGKLPQAVAGTIAMAMVIMISVAGSASVLSGFAGQHSQTAALRAALESQAQAQQESAHRLIQLDRISQAQPLLEKADAIVKQIATLPTPSGFYLAAQRIGGTHADALVTAVIVIIALLLDSMSLLLTGVTSAQATAVTPEQKPSNTQHAGVTAESNSVTILSNNVEFTGNNTFDAVPPLCNAVTSHPDVQQVHAALSNGVIESISVRNVRAALGCGQRKAVEIARLCQQASDQLALI